MAGDRSCRVVRSFFYFGYGITDRDRQTGAAQERKIGKIVANISDHGIRGARFPQDFFIGRHL